MTNYVKYDIIILLPSLELVVGGNFMGSINTVSYEHLRSLEDEARRLIDEVVAPEFEILRNDYPNAQRWDICIQTYAGVNGFDLIYFVTINLAFGTNNPKGCKSQCNFSSAAICDILPKVDQILNAEQQKYGITVDESPLRNKYMTMHIYTKFNSK